GGSASWVRIPPPRAHDFARLRLAAPIGLRPIGLLSCSNSVDFARLRLAAPIGLRPIGLLNCSNSVDFARLRLAAPIGLRPIGLLNCSNSVDFARLGLAARGAFGAACGMIQAIALPGGSGLTASGELDQIHN